MKHVLRPRLYLRSILLFFFSSSVHCRALLRPRPSLPIPLTCQRFCSLSAPVRQGHDPLGTSLQKVTRHNRTPPSLVPFIATRVISVILTFLIDSNRVATLALSLFFFIVLLPLILLLLIYRLFRLYFTSASV